MNFGSVCSGIEAASLAFEPLGFSPLWYSEIGDFSSRVLHHHYPMIENLGDMNDLPSLVASGSVSPPDLLCGGTPCQAFSYAGWKKGLTDSRGQLTLKFIEIADEIDRRRHDEGKKSAFVLWENVVGVLNDRTNAFGAFISGLAGLSEPLVLNKKWSQSGVLNGVKRNIAWRILDAKYFALPQQRKRLFVVASDCDYSPEQILFERTDKAVNLGSYYKKAVTSSNLPSSRERINLFSDIDLCSNTNVLVKYINQHKIEIFREYTDCLYSAYGTKWNGNAAAYNGSLFVSQNDRLRRLTPVECERLMGFPDDYTLIPKARATNRYQAVGNSWAIPVVKWIGKRIKNYNNESKRRTVWMDKIAPDMQTNEFELYLFGQNQVRYEAHSYLNMTSAINEAKEGNIFNIIDTKPEEKFYISEAGCKGILRRRAKMNSNMNTRLQEILTINS